TPGWSLDDVLVTGTGGAFFDDFSTDQGWLYGPEWQRGPAVPAACPNQGSDPTIDHSPSADNYLAGILIGACTTSTFHPYYYLESPAIDTNSFPTVELRYWRDLGSDYQPYANN